MARYCQSTERWYTLPATVARSSARFTKCRIPHNPFRPARLIDAPLWFDLSANGNSPMRIVLLLTLYLSLQLSLLGEPPGEWIDPQTGHRVIRLSRDAGSTSFYFHQNTYT